jgi:hypothetical protein
MANRSKQKGKRFESRVAELIREKWKLSKDECHRAQSSGTFEVDYSDIIIRPRDYKQPHVIIECKYRNPKTLTYSKVINPATFLDKVNNQLLQAKEKYRADYGITPIGLMVYASAYMPIMVAMTYEDYLGIKNVPDYNLRYHSIDEDLLSVISYVRSDSGNSYVVMLLEEFLDLIGLIPR